MRKLVAVVALTMSSLVPAGAAQAASFPETVPLPNGFAPEGIDAGPGTTFYAGSLANGAIYRGDLRTGDGDVFIPGAPGRVAVGLFYERSAQRLWVAGGGTSQVRVYDARDGDLLATYDFGSGFLNDVVVTKDAAYVTDSNNQRLAVVPLGPGGSLPAAGTSLPLSGEIAYGPGFNANGIVAARGGQHLVLVQSNTQSLFRVDPVSGVAERIALTGGDARGGTGLLNGDGLELRGNTLWVVQNRSNKVAVVRLSDSLLSGQVTSTITDSDLAVPTTVVDVAGRLWAVNARFGTPVTPTTEYDVVRLPQR